MKSGKRRTRSDLCNKFLKSLKKYRSDILPDLPGDLITDILLRLPAKSIGRFKCASKEWRSSLSSSLFANCHLNFNRHNKGIIVEDEDALHVLTLDDRGNNTADKHRDSRNIRFPMFDKTVQVESSCNGLVLLRENPHSPVRYLVNPITLETAQVPEPFHHSRPLRYCLGYDRFGDYKIVSLGCLYDGTEPDRIHIYSVRAKTWKEIDNSDYRQFFDLNGVFVNGCVHWLISDYLIAALNLSTEEFEFFPTPCHSHLKQLTVLEGCLCLVYPNYDVWVMKECWTKLFNVNRHRKISSIGSFQLVCSLKEDETVLFQTDHRLVAYNWRYGALEDFDARKLGKVTAFTESLMYPN